ncbi:hypothetical protein [Efunavirus EF1]|uniref:Phage protein n=1 Tax=Enterococcus phage EF1 TaxID=2025813 RepID=A0A249XXK4_9CAUD|nr:hypothetical protein [Enterococcus phage EF1]ASZ77478.1 hypothetical protein [Enterococcus phage EF5]
MFNFNKKTEKSSVKKYRKKPVEVEVWLFNRENLETVESWVRKYSDKMTLFSQYGGGKIWIEIKTLEGVMKASEGDYIIKGINGELYPCKPDIFIKTYEEVTN